MQGESDCKRHAGIPSLVASQLINLLDEGN